MRLRLGASLDSLEALHLTGERRPGPGHRHEYPLLRGMAGPLAFVPALARPLSAFGDTGHPALPRVRVEPLEAPDHQGPFLNSRSTASDECPTFRTASESRSFDTSNLSAQYCTS